MTAPDDLEPDGTRGQAPAPGADWRRDASFRVPERVPWSELGPDFTAAWSGADPARGHAEHLEIVGPSGSGKTHLMLTMLQDHYRHQEAQRQAQGREHIRTGAVLVVTKADDDVFGKLGWPVVASADEIRDTNVVYWPRTSKTGTDRRTFHEARVRRLLDRMWQPGANSLLAFDEVGYVESLSGELRAVVQQYWREGRSLGITVVAMKQRPQGALRDMHSETAWTAVFKPKDRGDAERFAELLGHRRDWVPVLDSLDRQGHEFVLRHAPTEQAYISWVDTPLEPQKIRRRRGVAAMVSR
jgi:nucleoside-triphosphatase THEP1